MATNQLRPKVAYLCNGITQKLPFYECAVKLFQEDSEEFCTHVNNIGYTYADSVLVLTRQPGGIKLYHPVNCPLLQHATCDKKEVSRKDDDVFIGAAILLRSADGFTLLSRRSKKLRTFPGVWVPPGGHIEQGETPEEAAIRELGEEVGIVLTPSEYNIKTLCLFESCFPPFFEWGQPKRHHIVIYYLMTSSLKRNELSSKLVISEAEVDACMWLSDQVSKAVVEQKCDNNIPSVDGVMIQDGVLSNVLFDPAIFTSAVTGRDDHDVERISTGTLIALKSSLEQRSM